jgi:hypothetical protein
MIELVRTSGIFSLDGSDFVVENNRIESLAEAPKER